MYGNVRNQQFQHNPTVLSAGPPMNSNNNGSHGPQGGAPFAHMISLTQQPPLPQPVPAPQAFVEKLPIGLDHAPHSFNLREKVLGTASANLQYISKETGVQITLRGIGSLFVEPNISAESQEPLHLLLEHQRFENLNSAKQLAKNLIETLHQEFLQYQQVAAPQTLPSTQIPPPQLNVPPPNVIANAPPPGVSAPLSQHQQLSLVQQQFIPQNGLQMQLAQNGMIIQQQHQNLSMPPPTTSQSTILPMKPANQIQLQFHQPPPTLSTQQAPIILNTQPQSIQYQYYQQTTTRDMQGNQQVTLQPFIQQTNLPMQSQPQYITVQQGNTAYMVPQSTLIQQAPLGTQPPTQYSIIQQQTPTTHQTAQLQMQIPLMNIQPTTQHALPAPQRQEMKNDVQIGAQDAESLLQEDPAIELRINSSSDQLNSQNVARQHQLTMPITNVPPPPLNMSVPPPVHSNLLAGNATVSSNMQQIQQPASVLVDNSNNWPQAHIPPPPLGQPLTEMHPQQAIGQQQSVAVTFTQQPLQQTSQHFVQLQQQHNQQQQQQFSIIQTAPLNQNNNNNTFQQQQILQFQQLQPSSIQVQQQAQYSQQQPLLLQQQQIQQHQQLHFQLNQQQQLPVESSNQVINQASNVRSGQKRRSTSEQETSASGGPPPSQQIRSGMGHQSSCLNNVTLTLTSAAVGNASNVAEAVSVSGQDSPANHKLNSANTAQYSQQQQNLKPTHVGVMRYNQNPQRSAFDTGYPPPRNRMTNYNNVVTANQYNTRSPSQHHQQLQQQQQQLQLPHNNYGQRMQFMHTQPPPPLPTTNAFGTGAGLKRMPRP